MSETLNKICYRNPEKLPRISLNPFVLLLCSFCLLLPVIINQGPFLYFDSGAYLSNSTKAILHLQHFFGLDMTGVAGPVTTGPTAPQQFVIDENTISGRSIFYSFFVWFGTISVGFGAVVFFQALAMAVLIVAAIQITLPRISPTTGFTVAVAIAAGLGLLTSAGFFTSLVMPDIWSGMMILAFALLMASNNVLSAGNRVILTIILGLAVLFHTTHLLLLAVLTAGLALARLRPCWRNIVPRQHLFLPVIALVFGVAGHVAFSTVVTLTTGRAPVSMPFLTAHLVDMGPGYRLVRDTCPDNGFALCPYADRLPTDWITFLFGQDTSSGVFKTVPPSVQRALSEEQMKFALATLAAEPLETVTGFARDGVVQLWKLSVDDVPLTAKNDVFLVENFPPKVVSVARLSTIWNRPWVAPALSQLIAVGTAVASVGLALMYVFKLIPRRGPLATLLLVCVAGIVLNALICGALASPYGRFQARVAWLLPLLLALTVLTIRFPAFTPAKRSSQ